MAAEPARHGVRAAIGELRVPLVERLRNAVFLAEAHPGALIRCERGGSRNPTLELQPSGTK